MISEGESDLVLNRLEYECLVAWIDRTFDLVAAMKDSVGTARGGWWCDSRSLLSAARGILVEAAAIRSITLKARQECGKIWYDPPKRLRTSKPIGYRPPKDGDSQVRHGDSDGHCGCGQDG